MIGKSNGTKQKNSFLFEPAQSLGESQETTSDTNEVGPLVKWRETFQQVLQQGKSPKDLRPILAWLNQLPELSIEEKEGLWQILSEQKPEIFSRLMIEVAKNVSKVLPGSHPYSWVYERLLKEAIDTSKMMEAYIRGELSWGEYLSNLYRLVVAGTNKKPTISKKAFLLRFLASAIAGALKYRSDQRYPELLFAVLASTLSNPRVAEMIELEKVVDKDRYAELIFELGQSRNSTSRACILLLPFWGELQEVLRVRAKQAERISTLESRLKEVLAENEELKDRLLEVDDRVIKLQAEIGSLQQELTLANEKYDLLLRTSERAHKQRISGVINSIRRNLEHDLSEIVIALEERQEEREVQFVLKRVQIIREYLSSLEVK